MKSVCKLWNDVKCFGLFALTHFPCVLQLFPCLPSSHDVKLSRSKRENGWGRKRGAKSGLGRKGGTAQPVLAHYLASLVFLHPREPMAKNRHWNLTSQITQSCYDIRQSYTSPAYASQRCHSAMQNSLSTHGIHNNIVWSSHWALGLSDHPTYCSGLKSFGPYPWELEPVGWTSRHYSNGHEPQRVKELKSQVPIQARDC